MRNSVLDMTHFRITKVPTTFWSIESLLFPWRATNSNICWNSGELHNLGDRTFISLIQEQRLEHVVIEAGVVQTCPGAVRIKIHFQNLRLHYSIPCEAKKSIWILFHFKSLLMSSVIYPLLISELSWKWWRSPLRSLPDWVLWGRRTRSMWETYIYGNGRRGSSMPAPYGNNIQ